MLDALQRREFEDVGFTTVADVFDRAEVERMREAFDRLERTAQGLGATGLVRGSLFVVDPPPAGELAARIRRIVWCGAAEPALDAFGRDRRLLELAAGLLGSRELDQLINQAHYKRPGDGTEFPWHQDSTHRRYGTDEWRDVDGHGSFVQIVTAIDDMTESNGPLQFVPGSGRLGHLGVEPGDDAGFTRAGVALGDAVSLTLRAGSVALFGPFVVHRSLPNSSAAPRRVLINGFSLPGANYRVYPGDGAGRRVRL